jgi:hypothetical protein
MQQELKCAVNVLSVKKIVTYQGLRRDTMLVSGNKSLTSPSEGKGPL